MLTQRKMQYDKAGAKVAEALNKRYFEAYYCSDRAAALEKILELIPQDHVVSWGGTATVDELGVKEALRQRGQAVIDRDTAKDAQERQKMLKQALTCDTFLMGSNAISADGQLVNIDGTGNRVAATLYGPEKVYFIVGLNKLAPTLEAAIWRARNIASPLNAKRLNRRTPCALSEVMKCYDCQSPERICRGMTIHMGPMKGVGETIVVLIDEKLGY